MDGSSEDKTSLSTASSRIGEGKVKFRKRLFTKKKLLAATLAIAIVAGGGFVYYQFLQPLYEIDGIKITKSDVENYAKGIEEYKKDNKDANFGGEPKKVASDDLVLNAAFRAEAKKLNDHSTDSTLEILKKKVETGSPNLQKVKSVRQQNNAYQKNLGQKVLAQKDLFIVSTWYDAPFYSGKNKQEVQKLYDQAINNLNTKYVPLFEKHATRDQIAKFTDVNTLDANKADDENFQLYFKQQVTGAKYQQGYVSGMTTYNELDQVEYNGVTIPNQKTIKEEVDSLKNPGDFTKVFASKTGAFEIIRLEKKSGGMYDSWSDIIATYKKQHAKRSLFAYEFSPSEVLTLAANQVILAVTNPGLEKAYAIDCSGHNVTFVIRSIDISTLTVMPVNSTIVNQYRRAHNCGSQYTGNRDSNNAQGEIKDNCYGPAPTWSVTQYADSANWQFVKHQSSTNDVWHSTPGWPNWQSAYINEVGTIQIDFWYLPKGTSPRKLNNVDVLNCNQIAGWIFDETTAGGITGAVEVHVYFNAENGQPGAIGWNTGAANKSRTDVNAAYPGVGDNHGFDFNPQTSPPAGLNVRDGAGHNVYFYAVGVTGAPIKFYSGYMEPCPIQPPTLTVTANCDEFKFEAVDPEGSTSRFNYTVHVSNGSPVPWVQTLGSVSGQQVLDPWAPDGIELGAVSGTDWHVWATEAGGNGLAVDTGAHIDQCPFNQFRIKINDTPPKLLDSGGNDDDENPAKVTFNTTFTSNNNVKPIQIKCEYYVKNTAGTTSPIPGATAFDAPHDFVRGVPFPCGPTTVNIPAADIVPGNQLCALYTATPGAGRADIVTEAVLRITQAESKKETCTPIVNKPFVSFYGSDLMVGGGYADCTTHPATDTISTITRGTGLGGSGAEFAAFAMGAITGFNTGRGNGVGGTSLAFANTSPVGNFGKPTNCLTDYYVDQNNGGAPLTTAPDLNSSNKYLMSSGGSFAGATGITGHAVLYVNGNLTITGNTTFATGPWASIDAIPSLYVVVRGNIYIAPNVMQLDGVYVAQPGYPTAGTIAGVSHPAAGPGFIYSCYNSGSAATDERTDNLAHRFGLTNTAVALAPANDRFTNCSNQLHINGAFQAQHVFLDRSYKSLRDAAAEGSYSGSKAGEVFSMGPELYMAITSLPVPTTGSGSNTINSIQTLPPVL